MSEIIMPGHQPETWNSPHQEAIQPWQDQPRWSLDQLVASWLATFTVSENTVAAYRRDLRQYLGWCATYSVAPLAVRVPEAKMYLNYLANVGNEDDEKPYGPRTINRKLSAASSFYSHLVESSVVSANPFRIRRPTFDRRHSPTQSISEADARAMLAHAPQLPQNVMAPAALHLVMCLLIDLGARVSEVCNVDLDDVRKRDSTRVLNLRAKGNKIRVRPITASIAPVLDTWLHQRKPGKDATALFIDTRVHRVTRQQVYALFQRLALAADIEEAHRVTPHSARHAFNTIARQRGAALSTRRIALGHASASTTELYDHQGADLDTDPAHQVSAATAPSWDQEPGDRDVDQPRSHRHHHPPSQY